MLNHSHQNQYNISLYNPFHATSFFLYHMKLQKTSAFLMFSGHMGRDQLYEMSIIIQSSFSKTATTDLKLTLKSCTAKKIKQRKLKSPPQGKIFFTFTLQFSAFFDKFKLVQRAFSSGSIMFSEINLVHN